MGIRAGFRLVPPVAVVSALLLGAASAPAASRATSERIVIHANETFHLITPAGVAGAPYSIPAGSTFAGDGTISHDGTRIAFAATVPGGRDIFTARVDGTGLTSLTPEPGLARQPSFSWDGTKIAFTSNRDGGDDDIWVMNADGSNQVNVTPGNPSSDFAASFSPDGTRVAYSGFVGTDFDIRTVSPTGTGFQNLTPVTSEDTSPHYSPDGSRINFTSDRDGGDQDLFTMNASNGSGVVNLTPTVPQSDLSGPYSPTGSEIAFPSQRDGGDSDVFRMAAIAGSTATLLTGSDTGFNSVGGWVTVQLCGGQLATQVGTQAGEKLKGTSGVDVIVGNGGNDTIKGMAGADIICGDAGKDKLKGEGGKDRLFGGAGKDNLNGGTGKDTCKGEKGRDSGGCEKGKL